MHMQFDLVKQSVFLICILTSFLLSLCVLKILRFLIPKNTSLTGWYIVFLIACVVIRGVFVHYTKKHFLFFFEIVDLPCILMGICCSWNSICFFLNLGTVLELFKDEGYVSFGTFFRVRIKRPYALFSWLFAVQPLVVCFF